MPDLINDLPVTTAVVPKTSAPKPAAKALRDPAAYVVTDARTAIMVPTDDKQLADLLSGAEIPLSARKMAEFASGAVVRGIPAVSVAGMLADGIIRKADADEAAKAVTVGGGA